MKDSMLKPVRREAGLGDPPSTYTNNDPESANFIIKNGLNFNTKKPHEFIDKIKYGAPFVKKVVNMNKRGFVAI